MKIVHLVSVLLVSACGSSSTTMVPDPQPSSRTEYAMVYDATRQRVLLFGGGNAAAQFNDLWSWDGSTWTLLSASGPSARVGAIMAWDDINHRVLLYGGVSGASQPTDLWSWNGTAWTQLSASGGPPIRHAAGGYDNARARLVVHRGFSGSAPQRDTWEWDGATWTQAATTTPIDFTVPLPSAMVWDTTRHALLMLTGEGAGSASSLWQWSGTAWTELGFGPSIVVPAPVTSLGGNAVIALHGNPASVSTMVTHRWNGTSWSVVPGAGPPKRFLNALAFDAARHRVVLFGGQTAAGVLGDTWEWDGAAWTQR